MKRRQFISTVGLGVGAYSIFPNIGMSWEGIPSRKGKIISGRKLNIACVGIGGRGQDDIKGLAHENIMALCDVNKGAEQKKTIDKFPEAKVYTDYRKMLLEMDEQIDAVLVATPDHMHFPIAMMAMQMGKHVYVEKPIAHTVEEARIMTRVAREKNIISQCGNQGHAGEGVRNCVEWVRAGVIGNITEVHAWTNRPLTSGYYKWYQGVEKPTEAEPVPSELDWNLWLGVAPYRDYHSHYVPKKWRGWWDFGGCALGDMGCHILDGSFWALDLKYPVSVEVDQKGATKESGPLESTIIYSFPTRNAMPPVKVFWYDGGRKPPVPVGLEKDKGLGNNGFYMVGDKGVILSDGDYCQSPQLVPQTAMKEFLAHRPEKTIARVPNGNQFVEWTKACKGEGPMPGSNFDYSGPLSEMILMGNLAVRINKKIEWDGPNMICTNLPEVNQLVKKNYRAF